MPTGLALSGRSLCAIILRMNGATTTCDTTKAFEALIVKRRIRNALNRVQVHGEGSIPYPTP